MGIRKLLPSAKRQQRRCEGARLPSSLHVSGRFDLISEERGLPGSAWLSLSSVPPPRPSERKMRVPLALLFACSKCGCSPTYRLQPHTDAGHIPTGSPWQSPPRPAGSLTLISAYNSQKSRFLVALGVFTSVSVRGKGPGALAPGLEGSTVGNLTARSCYLRWRSGGMLMTSVDRYKRRHPGRLTLAPGWLVLAPSNPSSSL